MKLISNFHDYYDTALSFGRDETAVYVRRRSLGSARLPSDVVPWAVEDGTRRGSAARPKRLIVRNTRQTQKRAFWLPDDDADASFRWLFDEAFVLIAGKAWPTWIRRHRPDVFLGDAECTAAGDASEAALCKAMAEQPERSEKAKPEVVAEHPKRDDDVERRYEDARARFLARDHTSLHLEIGAPVLLVAAPETLARGYYGGPALPTATPEHNLALVRNPRLADLHFQRTLDPSSCFQQVSQFISGVAPGRQMPMIAVSDATQVRKKGFDPVYGFRKRPGTGR